MILYIYLILFISSQSLFSMSDRSLTFAESIVVGGVAGAGEVAFPGQVLSYAMNANIKKEQFLLSRSYNGFLMNASGEIPIFAIQKLVKDEGSKYFESTQEFQLSCEQKVAISFIAGVASAFIDTPSSAVQLYLQKTENIKKNTRQALQELGIKKSFRGFTADAFLKEGLFTVGYQVIAPQGIKIAQQYFGENNVVGIVGGVGSGIVTGVITQPGVVIRNSMQSDLHKQKYITTLQTAQNICEKQGVQGLFRGLTQRGVRIAIAVPLYVAYTQAMEDLIKK